MTFRLLGKPTSRQGEPGTDLLTGNPSGFSFKPVHSLKLNYLPARAEEDSGGEALRLCATLIFYNDHFPALPLLLLTSIN